MKSSWITAMLIGYAFCFCTSVISYKFEKYSPAQNIIGGIFGTIVFGAVFIMLAELAETIFAAMQVKP